MPVAALMKDIDPGLLELLKKEEGALVTPSLPGPGSTPSQTPPECYRSGPWGQRKEECCFWRWLAAGAGAFPPRPRWWRSQSSGHSQVTLRAPGSQCIFELEAHCGVLDAQLWGDRSSRHVDLRLGDQGGLRCPSLDFPGEIQNMRKSCCSSDGVTPGRGRVGEGVGGSRCHGEAHLHAGLGAWAPGGAGRGQAAVYSLVWSGL